MKKIILSLINLSPNKFGSYEEFELNLAKKAKEENIKLVQVFKSPPYPELENMFNEAKATIDVCTKPTFINLYKLIKKHKPDLVHLSFFPACSRINYYLKILGVKKIVITDHSSGQINKGSFIKETIRTIMLKTMLNPVDHFIAVSNFVKKRLVNVSKMSPNKVTTIYNGINTERFKNLNKKEEYRKKLNIPKDATVFITIGQLIPEKGINFFLEAASMLSHKHDNVFFVITGEGSEESNLKQQVKDLKIEDKVLFLEKTNNVEEILQAGDVFVCPSVWQESFGLVIIEAMACELPVIATNVGAIPEIVDDQKNGFIVQSRNSQKLTEKMVFLFNNPNLKDQLAKKGRQKVEENFTLEKMAKETIQLYINMLNNGL